MTKMEIEVKKMEIGINWVSAGIQLKDFAMRFEHLWAWVFRVDRKLE